MEISRRTVLAGAAALGAVPFGGVSGLRAQAPLSVVATTGMVADAVRSVAGLAAEVQALMGPGIDPHAYRQTRTDIVALSQADMVFWNGLYLEAQMEEVLGDLAARMPVVALAEGVPVDQRLADADYADRFDPHVWMDPVLWNYAVETAATALAERVDVARGLVDTKIRLSLLSDYSSEVLADVPEEARVLVTAHDAFGYFGRAYGFSVEGIQGISTESEAGLARIAELVDFLVDRRIPAVFVETSVSDRNIRALIEGAAAAGHEVRIGGELFSDAMGTPGTYEGTYEGMIDHNVTTIARALGGTPPDRGLNGRLSLGG